MKADRMTALEAVRTIHSLSSLDPAQMEALLIVAEGLIRSERSECMKLASIYGSDDGNHIADLIMARTFRR